MNEWMNKWIYQVSKWLATSLRTELWVMLHWHPLCPQTQVGETEEVLDKYWPSVTGLTAMLIVSGGREGSRTLLLPPVSLTVDGWWFDLSPSRFRDQAKRQVLRAKHSHPGFWGHSAPSLGGGGRKETVWQAYFLPFKWCKCSNVSLFFAQMIC